MKKRCIYCGRLSWGRTCNEHKDLPRLELDLFDPEPVFSPSLHKGEA